MGVVQAGLLIAVALFILYLLVTGKFQNALACFKQYGVNSVNDSVAPTP